MLKREDRLRKHPFAGFGTVMEDIKRTSFTKNQPILLASHVETVNVTVSRNKFHRNIRMLPHEAPALLSSPAGKQV